MWWIFLIPFSCLIPLKARVGESVDSALSALSVIFLALSAYFNNFWQNVAFFNESRQKKVLFNCFATKQCWGTIKMWVSLSHYGSDSLSVSFWFVNQPSSHCRSVWANFSLIVALFEPICLSLSQFVSQYFSNCGVFEPVSLLLSRLSWTHSF